MKKITPASSHNHIGSHHLILGVTLMRNHNPAERFIALVPSRKGAIEAKCATCMGCTKVHLEEGFKTEVRNCTAPNYPLHSQALPHLNLGEAVNDEVYSGARA